MKAGTLKPFVSAQIIHHIPFKCSRVPLKRSPIQQDIAYITPVTETEHQSKVVFATETPYFALTGELWGVFYGDFEENRPLSIGTALFLFKTKIYVFTRQPQYFLCYPCQLFQQHRKWPELQPCPMLLPDVTCRNIISHSVGRYYEAFSGFLFILLQPVHCSFKYKTCHNKLFHVY